MRRPFVCTSWRPYVGLPASSGSREAPNLPFKSPGLTMKCKSALSFISHSGTINVRHRRSRRRVWNTGIPPILKPLGPVGIAACLGVALGMSPASALADYWCDNQCTLDRPRPALTNAGFRLDSREGTATESLVLGDGIVMHLEQSGCEYMIRTYTFNMKNKPDDTNILGWQYRKAVQLLSLLEERSNRKIRLADEKRALDQYSKLIADPKEEVEINIRKSHNQFSEVVSISSQIEGDETRIVVRVSSGPY